MTGFKVPVIPESSRPTTRMVVCVSPDTSDEEVSGEEVLPRIETSSGARFTAPRIQAPSEERLSVPRIPTPSVTKFTAPRIPAASGKGLTAPRIPAPSVTTVDFHLLDAALAMVSLANREEKSSRSSPTVSKGRWKDDEHKRFLEALIVHRRQSVKNWKEIADYVGTRTPVQCRSHFQKWNEKQQKAVNSGWPYKVRAPRIPNTF